VGVLDDEDDEDDEKRSRLRKKYGFSVRAPRPPASLSREIIALIAPSSPATLDSQLGVDLERGFGLPLTVYARHRPEFDESIS
jgi:hypothetical protein